MRERAFFTVYRTLLHVFFKIFKKDNFHIHEKYLINQIEIFNQQMHTSKQVILGRKVFKMTGNNLRITGFILYNLNCPNIDLIFPIEDTICPKMSAFVLNITGFLVNIIFFICL